MGGGIRYKRILLKLSGEVMAGEGGWGVSTERIGKVASEIKQVHSLGVELAIVVGGGNIWRGREFKGNVTIEQATSDHIGMLATVINALALQSILENEGLETRVQTAIEMKAIAEPYIRRRAIRHLEKGRIVIFAAGTGNPFFTTDSAAALRALEINAEAMLKGTKVDGVYDADPKDYPSAAKLKELEYLDILMKRLRVMDATAISLCMENKLPIIVFNIFAPGNLFKIIVGENIGTIVKE